MTEYYIWDEADLAIAQAALDSINNNERLPITGKNAKTGKLEPNKQKTIKWANEVQVFVNGTVGFPRITTEWLDRMNVPAEERQAFLDTFNPTIAEFDPAWLPPEEELI